MDQIIISFFFAVFRYTSLLNYKKRNRNK